jgi:hypothetical protein
MSLGLSPSRAQNAVRESLQTARLDAPLAEREGYAASPARARCFQTRPGRITLPVENPQPAMRRTGALQLLCPDVPEVAMRKT